MKKITPSRIAEAFPLGYPLQWTIVTQPFGANADWYLPRTGDNGHAGLDLRAKTPKKCFAVCDGVIKSAGVDSGGGIFIWLQTDVKNIDGILVRLEILYYHLSREDVNVGQRVKRGDVIGLTGNTGKYTTAPHLHFAIRPFYYKNGTWEADWGNGTRGQIDPFIFLPGEHRPVDAFYEKKRNWILEYTFRFANTPTGALLTPFLKERIEAARYVHRRLKADIEKGKRFLPYLTDQENNAIIYGAWDLDFILEPANFQTWSMMTKSEYESKLGK